jgi:hypothetical protein
LPTALVGVPKRPLRSGCAVRAFLPPLEPILYQALLPPAVWSLEKEKTASVKSGQV